MTAIRSLLAMSVRNDLATLNKQIDTLTKPFTVKAGDNDAKLKEAMQRITVKAALDGAGANSLADFGLEIAALVEAGFVDPGANGGDDVEELRLHYNRVKAETARGAVPIETAGTKKKAKSHLMQIAKAALRNKDCGTLDVLQRTYNLALTNQTRTSISIYQQLVEISRAIIAINPDAPYVMTDDQIIETLREDKEADNTNNWDALAKAKKALDDLTKANRGGKFANGDLDPAKPGLNDKRLTDQIAALGKTLADIAKDIEEAKEKAAQAARKAALAKPAAQSDAQSDAA